jgi:hypothetical protein
MIENKALSKMVKALRCVAKMTPLDEVHSALGYIATLPLGPENTELGKQLMRAGLTKKEMQAALDNVSWISRTPVLRTMLQDKEFVAGLQKTEVKKKKPTHKA